jgi:hypothetical protein
VSSVRVPMVSAAAAAILASIEFGAASEVRTLVLLPLIETAVPPESDAVKERGEEKPVTAADGGGELVDLHGDGRLRGAKIRRLLRGRVGRVRTGHRDRADDGQTVEDVDLVTLALLLHSPVTKDIKTK